MEVTNTWNNSDINKYYIISLDKETNEWKFFRDIVGHTVFWKDKPSHYGMTKSRAIEVLNIVKNLTKEDIKPEPTIPTEPKNNTPTGTETPTNPTENEGTTTPTNNTSGETSGDTPTEPSESNGDTSTNTGGETSTGKNNNGETASTDDTEHNNTEPTNPVGEPTAPVEPETPTESQYKIITISSVTYNSTEVAIFDNDDYNKLKSTLIYINTTYPNTNVHVVTKSNTEKSIFYFYLKDELTWFLELRTNIDYSLVNHVTTLDDIKELL